MASKETLCSSCIHVPMCKFRDRYLEFVPKFDALVREYEDLVKVTPQCTYYRKDVLYR